MAIKFVNQVTKRLNALWNTSLQLSPRELEEGPVQLVNDVGNDLIRSFQGSIFITPVVLPVGTVNFQRNDVIAALHATTPTLGNDPARFILDADDIEYIDLYNAFSSIKISGTTGDIFFYESGCAITGTTANDMNIKSPIYDTATFTLPAFGTSVRSTAISNPEFKKNLIRLSSDQISSSITGGLPLPEYIATYFKLFPVNAMTGPLTVESIITYQIDICYKRPYQAIRNNSRALTSF